MTPRGLANTYVVNWAKLADSLEMACEIRSMSLRDVAHQIGISSSGLTRLRQGKHLDGDALASLVAWLYPSSIPLWITPAASSQQEGEDT